MRDDFSKKTKLKLQKLAGNCCSNPACRKLTIADINLGIAAHIKAASPNGPRYDPSQTKQQRSAIENGIWLCRDCAYLIDAEPDNYPLETLYLWKREAESRIRNNLSKPFYTMDEFEKEKNQTIQDIFINNHSDVMKTTKLFQLINKGFSENFHQEFKKLDSNLDIYPDFNHQNQSIGFKVCGGPTNFTLTPNGTENVALLKNALSYGYIDSKIHGVLEFHSPAMQKILEIIECSNQGSILLTSNKTCVCTANLVFIDCQNQSQQKLSASAKFYVGYRGFSLVIPLYNNLIEIVIQSIHFDLDDATPKLTIKLNVEQYILNRSILNIKNLEALLNFLDLFKKNELKIDFDSEYGSLMSMSCRPSKEYQDFIHLSYINIKILFMLQTIARHQNQDLMITEYPIALGEQLFDVISKCFYAISGGYSQNLEPNNSITMELQPADNLDEIIGTIVNEYYVKVVQDFSVDEPVKIMDQDLSLPKICHILTNVKIKKSSREPENNTCKLELIFQEGCLYQIIEV